MKYNVTPKPYQVKYLIVKKDGKKIYDYDIVYASNKIEATKKAKIKANKFNNMVQNENCKILDVKAKKYK